MSRDLYAHPPRPPDRYEARVSRRALFGLRLSPVARNDVDYDGAGERVRAIWSRPSHEALLRAMEPVAEVAAALAEAGPGTAVLDVGAGDGNAALACARRGASVTACDASAEMVARGSARTGDGVPWDVADAMALPYRDAGFDAVVSAFGAVLAPDPARAARELVRVTRPGGLVVLAAWVRRGLPGRLDEFTEQVSPLPQGVPSPSRWGVEAVARARLEPLLEELEIRSRSVPLRFPDADAAFEAIAGACIPDPDGLAELRPAFDRLLASCNESRTGVEIRARYLVARGRVPALTPG